MIRSRLHKFLSFQPSDPVDISLWRHMESDPHYVFNDEVRDLLCGTKQADDSIMAMAEFGLVHIPYPRMTVEFNGKSSLRNATASEYTWFAHITEKGDRFEVRLPYYNHVHDRAGRWGEKTEFEISGKETAICTVTNFAGAAGFDDTITQEIGWIGMAGLRMGVLMAQIAELDREEVPAPEKLNRHRIRKGEKPIRGYNYIRIGRVVDASGNSYERGTTGRHMPIHLRAGHVRRQHFGKDRAEVKRIWIAPVLVNYKPGDTGGKPILERRVVV